VARYGSRRALGTCSDDRGRWLSCLLPIFFAIGGAAGCCEEPPTPCIPWLRGGETYQVDLVQHYDSVHDSYNALLPFGRYTLPEKTCGRGLDLDEGDTIRIEAGPKTEGDGRQGCMGGCYYRRALPTIPRVQPVGDSTDARDFGGSDFSDAFPARIGESCAALRYTIGIIAVSPTFIERSDEYIATDYMLYRELLARDTQSCAAPGSEITEKGECWDSWAVRITDSNGQVLTKDQPFKPPVADADAGSDAGGT